jgi:dTDP-4-dehydrorhamnose 3,5-epimerase
MKVSDLGIGGVKLVELTVFADVRGFFVERYNESLFRTHGLPTRFFQDNHSRSLPGVLRGLHYQSRPPQGKLVGVVRGRIWDVAVDIRPHSPTFGAHSGVELSDDNGCLLWIPAGFAHGFCVVGSEPADVLYKTDGSYEPASEGGIIWSDPDLAIPWPVANPAVSERDMRLPPFAQYRHDPVAW